MKTALVLKDVKVHSIRYDAFQEDSCIKSIYIHKSHLTRPYPKAVIVEITEVSEEELNAGGDYNDN